MRSAMRFGNAIRNALAMRCSDATYGRTDVLTKNLYHLGKKSLVSQRAREIEPKSNRRVTR